MKQACRRGWRIGLIAAMVGSMAGSMFGSMACAVRPMKGYEQAPTLPRAAGELRLAGLRGEVKVYRDHYGVPHIMTDNDHDLFFADGYVQAQDRLWEMVLFRAIAAGRLSEIFGDVGVPGQEVMGMEISTVAMDRRMRTMGLRWLGELGVALLAETQPDSLAQLQAYCDGVNAFIAEHPDLGQLPVEFQVLYYQPEPFAPADIIALSRFYGSMLGANLDDELARYALLRKYGQDMAWKLMPLHDSLGPTVVPTEMLKNRLPAPKDLPPGGRPGPSLAGAVPGLSGDAAMQYALFEKAVSFAALFPSKSASNNWVVGPKLTETGTAMLANDPHLLHIEPSLCYTMHLLGNGRDSYGCVFPGQPYVVMGHARKIAWGATVTYSDTQDLFVETTDKDHPNQYKYQGEWRNFTEREEIIRVRPGTIQTRPDHRFKEVKFTVRTSIHGPIMNESVPKLGKDTPPLALRWAGWDFTRDPRMFETFTQSTSVEDFRARLRQYDLKGMQVVNESRMFDLWSKAESCNDFITGISYNGLLSMNWICADSGGHIAYMPVHLVPIRGKGVGALPAPGESGEYDWTGFIPINELPQAVDPERGYMATANNQVVDARYYPYVYGTGYDAGYRSWRIEELINELKPLNLEKMKRIQNDVHMKQADVFAPMILQAVESKGIKDKSLLIAAELLRDWDHEATVDSVGTSIFCVTMDHLTDRVLKDDFQPKDYAKLVKGHAGLTVQMMFIRGNPEFMDNKKTPGKLEDADDALVGALADAVKYLTKEMGPDMTQWQWGKIHAVKWFHPMGFGPLKDMSIGPFPHSGASTTVRCAGWVGLPGKYQYLALEGPVMRHVIDLGDVDHAQLVIDGSQSGQWLSPHYQDQHEFWLNSQYLTAEKRPDKVAQQAESVLTLRP
jgi:penicillin G amidase